MTQDLLDDLEVTRGCDIRGPKESGTRSHLCKGYSLTMTKYYGHGLLAKDEYCTETNKVVVAGRH